MCVKGTRDALRGCDDHTAPGPRITRRQLLGAGLATSVAALVPAAPAAARKTPARRIADLTHTFGVDVPTYRPEKPHRETMEEFPEQPEGEFGFYNQRWTFTEHVGTHMDAPGHVIGGGRRSPEMTPRELIAPAVVINIRAKAQEDPNAVVEVADLVAFERRHGRIPDGAAVFMDSGWAARWDEGDLAYRGTQTPDEFPFNFPGWSADACAFLVERRNIVGVGVDTLSTDPGNSTEFPAHEVLGRADRWGLENLTNLDQFPPRGTTAFVGLVPWEEGSGGPARVIAVW
jgi:kynurenine formamidase